MKTLFYIIGVILLFWILSTVWAQLFGKQKMEIIGPADALHKALIIYTPDPIYNLDEQVCKAFAAGLLENGYRAVVSTNKMDMMLNIDYDLYVFCANTYNWAPDWGVKKVIQKKIDLKGKEVVAITVGSGSTTRAKRLLEKAIIAEGGHLIGSETYWLMRPNDENRMDEDNNKVAQDMAKAFGFRITQQMAVQ